jgi:phenylacetate-CoA ligase
MMAHFGAFNTRGVPLVSAMATALRAERCRDFHPTVRGLTVGLSSGTSGHRGLFLVSPWEQAAWAGTVLGRTLPCLRRRGYAVAFFLRSNSNLYENIGGRWIRFRWFDLMTPLADAVAALNEYRPDIIVGPPSLLGLLADERDAGRLRAAPERLISVAEVLEPQDERRLTASFQAPVHQIYQCTEGLLAVSCPHGTLHVQEDVVALQYEPLPDGKRVTPVVTDLWRRTQPIIRYRLNDVLVLDRRSCRCGSAFQPLARVEGRCDDICYFEQAGEGITPFFPDTVRRMVLLGSEQVLDYRAVQERCGQLRIHLAITPGAEFGAVARAVRDSAAATVAGYGCRAPTVVVEEGLPAAADGKRRRVQRVG